MPFFFTSIEKLRQSATIPCISQRQRALLTALYSGSWLRLYLQLCKIAHEDQELSLPGVPADKKKQMLAMTDKFIKDRTSGNFYVFRMLLTLPPEVIEALILNIIGHRVRTDANFEKLCYKFSQSSGVYINTLLIKNTDGKFLTNKEWNTLLSTIKRYCNGGSIKLRRDSSVEDKNTVNEAIRIDNAYAIRSKMTSGHPYDPQNGDRFFVSTASKPHLFYDMQKKRVKSTLDPIGNIRHIQSPIECGISRMLPGRMGDHGIKSDLANGAKLWGMTLSCLKVLGHKVDIVSLPMLKVWNMEMLKLGEILITMLSSALVEDGGFNGTQAGNSGGGARGNKENFSVEISEVFVQNSFLADNLQPALREIQALLAEPLDDHEHENMQEEIHKLQETATTALQEIDEANKRLDEDTTAINKEIEQMDRDIEKADEAIAALNGQWNFHTMVQDWMTDLAER